MRKDKKVKHVNCHNCGKKFQKKLLAKAGFKWYCPGCATKCSCCGREVIKSETITAYGLDNEGKVEEQKICSFCEWLHYVWSDYDQAYVKEKEAVWSEEGDCFRPDSKRFRICTNCGAIHTEYEGRFMEDLSGRKMCGKCWDKELDRN